jgi:putative transposase
VAANVGLIQQLQGQVELAVAPRAIGLARSTWYYRVHDCEPYGERYRGLRAPLERIARAHPEYGYRRTTTELREAHGVAVNQKVVRRLHCLWDLPLVCGTRPPRPSAVRQAITAVGARANLVAGLRAISPLAVLYTDFTQLPYARGKAWLMTFVDHTSKVAPGWAVGAQAVNRHPKFPRSWHLKVPTLGWG